MSEVGARAFTDEILKAFTEQGWRDDDDAAGALTLAAAGSASGTIADLDLRAVVADSFFDRHDTDPERLGRLLHDHVGSWVVRQDQHPFEIIPIDEIESFAAVLQVDPQSVAAFAKPLLINERVVKHCIHHLIGDPYIDGDWGGERSDVASARVLLDGRRTFTAFLLKGQSVKGPLYGSELGTRGDQMVRLIEQRAQLSIVQHIGEIPPETIDQLRYGVTALHATGTVDGAKASVWDGVDSARLLLGAGYIDEHGKLTTAGAAADEELRIKKKD